MITLILTQYKTAQIDDDDHAQFGRFNWFAMKCSGHWYAARNIAWPGGPRRQRIVFLHRAIMRCRKGEQVDHKDGNGLNNVRNNLRLSTQRQNTWNRGISVNNTSGYKGVVWSKKYQRWQAQIEFMDTKRWLGYHPTAEAAARVYDARAMMLHGEFAVLNFPIEARP